MISKVQVGCNSMILVIVGLFCVNGIQAQSQVVSKSENSAEITGTLGNGEGVVSASCIHMWRIGMKRKLEIGGGLRITAYSGNGKEFYTAPARLARSTTFPFAIVFADHLEKNLDTLTLDHALAASLNISVNFGYRLGAKWYAGFNIDLAGVTIGNNAKGVLQTNGTKIQESSAKPSSFNVLLTGDNDYGSLNSEFFLRYMLNEKWRLKFVYDFFFAEYKTQTVKQVAPDGTVVTRFRNKANTLGLGINHQF